MVNISTNSNFIAVSAVMCLLAACGADSSDAYELSGEIHACDLAPASEVSRIFGKTVSDATPSMESVNGKFAMSQCSYRFEGGGMGLSVQIRRSGGKVGVSRQADADASRKQKDSLGIGEDVAAAIETGTDIADLGDLAYEFDDQGDYQQLVVYWKDHYQMAIISFGGGAAADAAAARRELAQLVMDGL
jgi:hypothetical protein